MDDGDTGTPTASVSFLYLGLCMGGRFRDSELYGVVYSRA